VLTRARPLPSRPVWALFRLAWGSLREAMATFDALEPKRCGLGCAQLSRRSWARALAKMAGWTQRPEWRWMRIPAIATRQSRRASPSESSKSFDGRVVHSEQYSSHWRGSPGYTSETARPILSDVRHRTLTIVCETNTTVWNCARTAIVSD
jgi:hypothetical protein